MTTANTPTSWDSEDPHHSVKHHAGRRYLGADVVHDHVIIKWQTYLIVLLALLFLTALTVFVSQAEIWIAKTWDITIPNWINIGGVLIIATVKSALVCMYFMGLRYDKPLNALIFLFCVFALVLFLFFAMTDLKTRGMVRSYNNVVLTPGGTGEGLSNSMGSAGLGPRPSTGGAPLVTFVRETAIESHPDGAEGFWRDYYQKYVDDGLHPHHHEADVDNYFAALGFDHAEPERSSADRSRPMRGISGALLETDPAAHHGHEGDAHDGESHPGDEH